MAVNDYEYSRDRGTPAEVFEFWYGDAPATIYRYTNAVDSITLFGNTYAAVPITHDRIKAKGRGDVVEVDVTVPSSSAVGQEFKGAISRRVMYVKILKGHLTSEDDPVEWGSSFELHWLGRVAEHKKERLATVLTCNNLGAGLKRPGLQFFYQRPCQHVLYGDRCQVDKAAFTVVTTADVLAGKEVTLPNGWEGAFLRRDFLFGTIEWEGSYGTQIRSVTARTGDKVTLDARPLDLTVGDAVTLSLGCNRTTGKCRNVFSNIPNFGGQPSIPRDNPIGKNNHT
jgi:hypothetical protein